MASGTDAPGGGGLPGVGLGAGDGYETGRVDRVARPMGEIRPHYPALARQRGQEADVVVAVWVGARGHVDRAAVSRSAGPEFDEAALAAIEKARFHPALLDGRRVPSRVALRLHFRLDE
jgi:protein TonB